jgi:hypothetical protein
VAFSSKIQAKVFFQLMGSSSALAVRFSWAFMVNLEAAQVLECADDDFCQAQMPALQGVLSCGSSESAPPALLFYGRLSQAE